MLTTQQYQNSTTELSCTISTLFWERERKRHRTMGSNEWSNNVSSKSTPTMSDMWGKKFSTNWLEWHCSDVDKRLLCYCPLHCWRVEPPLLFLFLQRNFKILGKLYSKFGCLWCTACPLGMGCKQKHSLLKKLVKLFHTLLAKVVQPKKALSEL